ncbi:MAG: fumarate hydratase, class [Acidobacteriota bacterium]|jgi:fumarate hydratase class I|nr:fumarate hydratase, class [Acidobacteriota bacterium]
MTATAPIRDAAPESALFETILELIRRTSTQLPDDVVRAVTAARGQEVEGSNADVALNVIGCNIGLAKESSLPLCQDTGTILFYIHTPVGYDQLTLEEIAVDAVRAATKKGYLRQNSVDSITGKNTGDNTGPGSPVFHFHQWREPHVEIKLMLKGGGCENMNAQYSLPHPDFGGRDLKGVENAILDCILQAQGQGCGPGILGVCIGGDRGTGYMFAKEQLLRTLDDTNEDEVLAALEARVVDKANQSGIGPMGFGGKTTLLACKIGTQNRLPASFFVSVAYMCWAYRRRGVEINAGSGMATEWLY